MKKTLVKIFACFAVLCITIGTTYALSTFETCVILPGQSSVESESVGTSKKGELWAQAYSDSKSKMKVDIYAAWTGWPYTKEFSTEVVPKNVVKYTETQSRNSNFYIKLSSMGSLDTHGVGSIQAL